MGPTIHYNLHIISPLVLGQLNLILIPNIQL